jgi:integrase
MNRKDRKAHKSDRKRISLTLSRFLGRPVDLKEQSADDENMLQQATRVYGPYLDRNKSLYRLWVVDGSGAKKSVSAKTEEQAHQLKKQIESALLDHAGMTVGEALEEFLAAKRNQGLVDRSIHTLHYKLRDFLPLEESLRTITPARAMALYQAETERISRYGRPVEAMTHHKLLRAAKMFFRWLVEAGHITASPFQGVKTVGRAKAGKPQLRIDEARRLVKLLVEESQRGHEGAIACLLQLLLGLRSSEVLGRLVRDLDDGARILWIPRGKTKNARRRLEVPELLRPFLLRLAEGKGPERLLFCGERAEPQFHMWLWRQLRNFCERAGLPRVCPHSLRGLHSTLAIAAGSTPAVVAASLGHGSFAVTAKHYVAPDTLENTTVAQVASRLTEEAPAESRDPIERLRSLPPEKLEALLALLDGTKAPKA